MGDNQDKIKSIKVKFNIRKEDWAEFALKFKAIADEGCYDKILDGSETVPPEDAKLVDDNKGREQKRLRKVNKRGDRDLILATPTKEMSPTMVRNQKN